MPWKLKKEIFLIACGVLIVILAAVVWILNQSASTDILAAIGMIGGTAIFINSFPENGRSDS